ncbi:type I pantothenate kinase [Lacticaseibacillus nasuensis]|uniref:Pantothenate kinase n=1 Tax=Lacticaseibacillus nasuensis JCM 17158 TaxID=1291734 RepID=A0A0R1JR04_9LACO|nr:type I pantothenate kinase [Lacticaseibacillus nasuensis]KRK70836.1 pantothenate kinase [Lacticaseibacillus nasuensis JCM 17158]
MKSEMNYFTFSRAEWATFHAHNFASVTDAELSSLRSLNDEVSLDDVKTIYSPLRHLIHIRYRDYLQAEFNLSQFLGVRQRPHPFIIGIAGSVAVGKSTTARLLQLLLSRAYPDKRIQLITTDGFLYPNAELIKRGLLDRKGFPESYDMNLLIHFLNNVKNNSGIVRAPKYSHQIYDVVPGESDIIDHPDIVIVEGINVLQLPSQEPIYISDYFDFSVYIDADPTLIEQWYLERFGMLLDTAFTDPTNYYYRYASGDREAAFKMARRVWRDVNLKNLNEYILPTKNRADVILHKTAHHLIDEVGLRKF